MEKIERDGKVAVLYSPGFGAGWSTWAEDEQKETLCMDARIVSPVLEGDIDKAIKAAVELCPGLYTSGVAQLEVRWLDKGDNFEIHEYDGSESINVIGNHSYMTA